MNREERSFGYTMGIAGLLLAGLLAWRGHEQAAWGAGSLAVVLWTCGIFVPRLLQGPRRGWLRMAQALGWINARLVLSLIFVMIFTPIGGLLRLLRWDSLRLRPSAGQSEWVSYPERLRQPTHFERMY